MAEPSYYDCFSAAYAAQPHREERCGGDLTTAIAHPKGCQVHNEGTKIGAMCYLGDKRSIPGCSIAYKQGQVNDEAFKHPCIPIATAIDATGEKYLFCAPMSSFNGESLTSKYRPCKEDAWAWSVLNTWMMIGGNGDESGPRACRALHPKLWMANNTTDKRSYVNLDRGYWIEERFLPLWRGSPQRLEAESLDALQWAYAVAQRYRDAVGDFSRMTKPRRTPSPPAPARSLPSPPPTPETKPAHPFPGRAKASPNWRKRDQEMVFNAAAPCCSLEKLASFASAVKRQKRI